MADPPSHHPHTPHDATNQSVADANQAAPSSESSPTPPAPAALLFHSIRRVSSLSVNDKISANTRPKRKAADPFAPHSRCYRQQQTPACLCRWRQCNCGGIQQWWTICIPWRRSRRSPTIQIQMTSSLMKTYSISPNDSTPHLSSPAKQTTKQQLNQRIMKEQHFLWLAMHQWAICQLMHTHYGRRQPLLRGIGPSPLQPSLYMSPATPLRSLKAMMTKLKPASERRSSRYEHDAFVSIEDMVNF